MREIFRKYRVPVFTLVLTAALLLQRTVVYAADTATAAPEGFPTGKLIIALIVGLIIALVVNAVFKGELTTVASVHEARNYVRKDSLNLTRKKDLFLYSEEKREEIKKEEPAKGNSK